MRHLFLVLLSLTLVGTHPPARAADSEDKAREQAKVLYEVGMTAVEEGRFADAANTFDQAYRLHHNVILLWNAARAHHRAEQLPEARERYRSCLIEEDLPPKRRQQAADYMVEVELALRREAAGPPPQVPPPASPEETSAPPPPAAAETPPTETPPTETPPTSTTEAPEADSPVDEASAGDPAAEPKPEPTTGDKPSPLEKAANVVGRGVVNAASVVERALSGDFGMWNEGGLSWHHHENLFVRLGLGLGGSRSSLEGTFQVQPTDSAAGYTVGGDFVSSSPLMDLQLQVGMNLSEGWIVHGDLTIGGYTDVQPLEIEQEQVDEDDSIGVLIAIGPREETETGQLDFAEVQVRNVHVGVGSTLYLLPMNLYVGGGMGINYTTVTHRDIQHGSSAGFGMYLSTGKDWWIDDELSVGVGLRLHASWTDQTAAQSWSVRDGDGVARDARLTRPSDFTVLYGVLGLTVTYD